MSASFTDDSAAKEGSDYCLPWLKLGPVVSRAGFIEAHQRHQARNYLGCPFAEWQAPVGKMDG
jgi:hypothetical protein